MLWYKHTLFSHPMVSDFLKELLHIWPPVSDSTSMLDLNIILLRLMELPFEPVSECSIYFTIRMVFLLAITAAWRVSELQDLMARSLYTSFCRDRIIVKPHLMPNAKVVWEFHLNQSVFLLVYFPKPHLMLGENKLHILTSPELFSLTNRTRPFSLSSQLFVAISGSSKC